MDFLHIAAWVVTGIVSAILGNVISIRMDIDKIKRGLSQKGENDEKAEDA